MALRLTGAVLGRASLERYLAETAADNSQWRAAFRERFLEAVRQELTPRQFDVLWRSCIEGRSQKDIARELGVSPSAVCKHLRLARGRLQHLMAYNLDFQQQTERQ